MIIFWYHEIFSGWQHPLPCWDTLVLSAWKKSHDIGILSFCNVVKGQAKYSEMSKKTSQFSKWVKISILNMIFQMRWKNNQDMLISNCMWWIQNQLPHFVSHILGRWEYHWKDLPITSYPRVDWNSIEVLCRVLTFLISWSKMISLHEKGNTSFSKPN